MNAPEKIEVSGGTHVVLTWSDRVARFEAARLRSACSCAGCHTDDGRARTAAVLAGERPITIEAAELTGAYAINFSFGPDGHTTGIFTWAMLRDLSEEPS